MSVAAIVPAAGSGYRFDVKHGKTFTQLNGRPLLIHSLKVLQETRDISWIVVVVPSSEIKRTNVLLKRFRITKALPPCRGGKTRAESVADVFQHL